MMQDVAKLSKDLSAAASRLTIISDQIEAFIEGGLCQADAAQTAAVLANCTCNRAGLMLKSAADDLAMIVDKPLSFLTQVAEWGLYLEATVDGIGVSIAEEIALANQHMDLALSALQDAEFKAKAAAPN
jgi:hypothetical protein